MFFYQCSSDPIPFTHLVVYEISYMWFSAIACMFCFAVGAAISLAYKPTDPKKLNPDLISPGMCFLWEM